MADREYVTVFTANMARQLLRAGYQITDIKPDKNDRDRKRSLFIFLKEQGIEEVISEHCHGKY